MHFDLILWQHTNITHWYYFSVGAGKTAYPTCGKWKRMLERPQYHCIMNHDILHDKDPFWFLIDDHTLHVQYAQYTFFNKYKWDASLVSHHNYISDLLSHIYFIALCSEVFQTIHSIKAAVRKPQMLYYYIDKFIWPLENAGGHIIFLTAASELPV